MKNRYGQLPKVCGKHIIEPTEMFFYQDMLIKEKRFTIPVFENRLEIFREIIESAIEDFISYFGYEAYLNSYVYISAKNLFQPIDKPFNRPGWHCDGFMSNDINYVWSNNNPTVFNHRIFKLTQNDSLSIIEMEQQADESNNICYDNYQLVRLDQYNIHRVADVKEAGMRAFLKISFSKDMFCLKGNTHNRLLTYDWEMKERGINRNIPQCGSLTTGDGK